MIELYQKLVTLIAIELNCDWFCDSFRKKESILVVHVPFLESCIIFDIHPMAMLGMCKKLKYLTCQYTRGKCFQQ